jgi:methionyl-tRNA formyltransferase
MKIIFLGATAFSSALLNHALKNGFPIAAIFSIPRSFSISYSHEPVVNTNFVDLSPIAEAHGIPFHWINSGLKNGRLIDFKDKIKNLEPDLILVLGWYYKVPAAIRKLARYGAWGIHTSLLPRYAGGAPLVWSMIAGEKETGVTLFRLDDGVDSGDIIMQESFPINLEDTIKEVYHKATESSMKILIKALHRIDEIEFTPQDRKKIEIYPQRKPSDGEIDWSKPALEIYNFIRAQSEPYPGAFVRTCDNKKLVIEKARIELF